MKEPARYSPKPFPPYRFIPGVNPHPTESPQGHSYRRFESSVQPLKANNWFENETYLYGIDLYNHEYWWESHEAWESLWKLSPEDPLTRDFLQGLIKISAAFIKWQLKTPRGVAIHFHSALNHLQKVREQYSSYMGIDLPQHIKHLTDHFSAVINISSQEWMDPSTDYPLIQLQIEKNKKASF